MKSYPIKMLVIKFPIRAKAGTIELANTNLPTPYCAECLRRWPEKSNFINVGGSCFCEDCLTKHFNKETQGE